MSVKKSMPPRRDFISSSGEKKNDSSFEEKTLSREFMMRATSHQLTWDKAVRRILITLFAILCVYLIVLVGAKIRNAMKEYDYIGVADRTEHTIAIEAQGKVVAIPDVAITTIGLITEGETVAQTQQANTEVMNTLQERLQKLGVKKEDIKTVNYNISPRYDYTETGRESKGYTVTQQISVKIRDFKLASQVLGLAGELGLNSVDGLTFTIDDPEEYKKQAREKALENAIEKANELQKSLGIRFKSIVSYEEYDRGNNGMYFTKTYETGIGGGDLPQTSSGSIDVVVDMRILFSI